jgi:hypothetical protein
VTLASRTQLGLYEIVDAIGAGGMGEVYRARDKAEARGGAQSFAGGLRPRSPVAASPCALQKVPLYGWLGTGLNPRRCSDQWAASRRELFNGSGER